MTEGQQPTFSPCPIVGCHIEGEHVHASGTSGTQANLGLTGTKRLEPKLSVSGGQRPTTSPVSLEYPCAYCECDRHHRCLDPQPGRKCCCVLLKERAR